MSMHYCSPLGKIRTAVIICCFVLILGIFGYAYLLGSNNSVIPKDEIITNLDTVGEEELDYEYTSSYLKKYGIGNINTYKFNAIEDQLEADFYKELPPKDELAKSVANLFIEYFYDTIDLSDKKQVTDALLKCLFASIGDPYAYYRTEEEFNEYISSLEGGEDFVGIGVMMNQETLEILMVIPGSGAEEVGIKPRDVIYAVDGKTLSDLPKDDFLNLMKGEENTTVSVTVQRGDELIDFTITRKRLEERNVYYEITDEKIGVIQITQFVQTTANQFKQAVDYCTENGAVALIIDVRYNPGGLVNSAIAVIDYLTPDEENRVIASYVSSDGEYTYYTTDGHSVDLPIAILCNEHTASAAELFTAAMRDFGDAGLLNTITVGTTTYGKGVLQNSYMLYDNSGITYTIAYMDMPLSVNYDGVGIIPDFEVEETELTDAPLTKAVEEVTKLVNTNGNVGINNGAAA